MTFFPDDHASELRELFFESATELLQTLNEEGLELEKRPEDEEILRRVRRTVHTLKGDSAACGYTELSETAHALEEVLRPEIAAMSKQALAEVVLIAADTFSSMLSAYRGSLQPPAEKSLSNTFSRSRASLPAMSLTNCRRALCGANTSRLWWPTREDAERTFTTWPSPLSRSAPCAAQPCS